MAAGQPSQDGALLREAEEISNRVSEDIISGWRSFQAREDELEEFRQKQRLAGLQQGKKVGYVPQSTSTPIAPRDVRTPGVTWASRDEILDDMEQCLDRRSRDLAGRPKLPPLTAPKFKAGGDWKGFITKFRDMVKLADMKPSYQLAYLKQSVPEDAEKLLSQRRVESVEQALEVLTKLYEPVKDSWVVFQELQKISQQPGERLIALAGRIEEKAERCAKAIHLTAEALDELVTSRFKHAIADEKTRHQLIWDQSPQTLDQIVWKAQQFQDLAGVDSTKPKKTYRTQDGKKGDKKLQRELQEVKKELAELKAKKTSSPKRQPSFLCWNCGKKGHLSRDCRQPKKEDGYSFRPKNRKFKGKQDSSSQATQTKTVDLN